MHIIKVLGGLVLIVIAGCTPRSIAPEQAMPIDMQQYAWSHRPLLVFAADEADVLLQRQRTLLSRETEALTDREIVVIEVIGERVRVNGEAVHDGGARGLRDRYDLEAPDAFAAVLVGKDTGVKLRRDEPVEPAELFALIDGMPMRRAETHQRGVAPQR